MHSANGSDHPRKYVVVGAGLCGLTTAERLRNAGHDVTLLERRDRVAGLARSFNDDGFIFDVGPHYFFLNVRKDVSDYAKRLVVGPYSELGFRISSHFKGHEIAWPPSPTSLFKLPPRAMLHYFKRVVRHQVPPEIDFRGFTTFLYGTSMYDVFFGPYIRKKLPVVNGSDLHKDWWLLARRTIKNELDKGQDRPRAAKKDSLDVPKGPPPLKKRIMKALDVIYRLTLNMTSKSLPMVMYPHGGIGQIGEGFKAEYERQGGRLITNSGAVKFVRAADGAIRRVEWSGGGGGAVDDVDHVVWTGSIHELADLAGIERAPLNYLSIALIYVTTKKPIRRAKYLYTYFAEQDLVFNRLYFPTRAHAGLAPPGMDSVCAEVSPPQGVEIGDRAELEKKVVDGLVKLGYLDREDVIGVKIRVARDAYPVYPLDYLEKLKGLWARLESMPNLTAVGRTGQFYYNNMALTVLLGLDLARALLGQKGYWQEMAESGQLETAKAGPAVQV